MEILIKTSQLILSLSILIVLHELGHFLPARWFKTRVEKFYLFFDYKFSLFKVKKGETEYGIGWIPFGGYVKIAGMVDESMDTEQLKKPAEPWEFRSKPAWQRLIIMLGGVTVNALLGIVIYIGILFVYGEEFLPNKNVTYGIACDSLALEMGLKDGDKIVTVNGVPADNFKKIPLDILMNEAKYVEVIRNNEPLKIDIPAGFIAKLISKQSDFITPRFPFYIESFQEGSAAKKSGIKEKDQLIAINGKPTLFYQDFKNEIVLHKNQKTVVTIVRNRKDTMNIDVMVPETGFIGVAAIGMENYLKLEKIEYSMLQAIPAGTTKAFTTFADYIGQFKLIFNTEVKGYKQLGGFITFGKVFAPVWDWYRFWNLTAFFSIALAVMNLLPIPALDGGHVLFTLIEMITGRKLPERFLEYAQTVGMILLLSLLIYVNGNDIFKLFSN